jgi:CheY-like chemotaxis protein
LKEIKELMSVRAEAKGLIWDVQFDNAIPCSIKSDPTRLRQILINLVGNGIKFTEVGAVLLKCRAAMGNDGKHTLFFDVIDSGIGMNETQIRLLFQPFAQADTSMSRRFGGTGLGLTISKRFAGLMGGDIEVQSEKGKGSVFTLRIPYEIAEVAENNQTTSPANDKAAVAVTLSQNPLHGLKLLLVEDGPDNQRLISFLLKRAGAEVEIADNGEIGRDCALKALADGCPFDVILTDMQMPVMDGYTATAQLRARNYTGPIIALTAHAMKGDREKCLSSGCDDFATKPVDRVQLINMVAKYAKLGSSNNANLGVPQC